MENPGAFFPDDLLSEIFLKLRVKSLLRLTCVSKSWLSLISSRDFVSQHLRFSTDHHRNYDRHRVLLDRPGRFPQDFLQLPLRLLLAGGGDGGTYNGGAKPMGDEIVVGYDEKFHIIDSCNGLFCLVNCRTIILLNPSIRKYRELPAFWSSITDDVPKTDRWHDSTKIPEYFIHGFWYDEAEDDYKVVSVNPSKSNDFPGGSNVWIYSSKTDSWRDIAREFPDLIKLRRCGKVFKGKMHWTGFSKSGALQLISFDLAAENFETLDLGGISGWAPGVKEEIRVDSGFLHIVNANSNLLGNSQVWRMKEYGVRESLSTVIEVRNAINFDIFRHREQLPRMPDFQVDLRRLMVIGWPKDVSGTKLCSVFGYLEIPDPKLVYVESLVSPNLNMDLTANKRESQHERSGGKCGKRKGIDQDMHRKDINRK